jgi:hypothetical protein
MAQLATSDAPIAPTSQTPIIIDEGHIKSHVMMLLPSIANILEKMAMTHTMLLAKVHTKRYHILMMETDDEYIPHLAHAKFKLLVSKQVNESPEFAALKEETVITIMEFQ